MKQLETISIAGTISMAGTSMVGTISKAEIINITGTISIRNNEHD
jgi:hypothetical protein